MDELAHIKDAIDNHRKLFPKHRRYPKELWQQIIPFAQKYGPQTLAKELGINLGNLFKRINALEGNPKKNGPDFIPIPTPVPSRRITLALPHNIKLSIEL